MCDKVAVADWFAGTAQCSRDTSHNISRLHIPITAVGGRAASAHTLIPVTVLS